jgi:excinuclease ABC subunit A
MGANSSEFIEVVGARQNNLKGINLKLPLGELIVVTGVSGSGKSSLAFDTIYAEGQRRYVETFSPYARQFLDRMDKPKADRIDGIPPAIAIDQTNPVRTSRSTVGTMTELNDHLKLLFARAAQLFCRQCGQPVRRDSAESIYRQLPEAELRITFPVIVPHNFTEQEVRSLLERQGYRHIEQRSPVLEVTQDRVDNVPRNHARIIEALEAALKVGNGRVAVNERKFSSDLHCAECDIHYRDPVPNLFSFNSPIGACETCRGFGRTIGIDYDLVIPDDSRTLAGGAIKPWQTESYSECQDDLMSFARRRGIPTDVPWRELTGEQRRWVIDGEGRWEDNKWYGVRRFFDWLETKSYKMHVRVLLSRYRTYVPCKVCGGARLKPDALLWKIAGKTIHDVVLLPIADCSGFFSDLKLPAPFDEATDLLLNEIRTRLRYLVDVGLGYLTLDRQSRTLSGGEVQRVNLTTALGTSLVNTLYVLDEPSIGLHPRDIHRLIGILHRLRDAGNTLLVVEHDPDVIRAADKILDLGPGPGERGGEVVFFGRLPELKKCKRSLTGKYLVARPSRPFRLPKPNTTGETPALLIKGAAEHNLKSIDVDIPLNRLVCITGVSGSGKSTLVEEVLYRGLLRLKGRPAEQPGRHRKITGHEQVEDIVLVDQSPIGRTTRSNPASYVGAFDEIRQLFAVQPLARERSYTAGTFSFNSGDGRCPTCHGNGFEHIEMQFLSDVYLRCPDCNGRRYRDVVLEVTIRKDSGGTRSVASARGNRPRQSVALQGNDNGSYSIADILELTVNEACEFFAGQPEVLRGLEPLRAVGLGYIRLGQPVPTLSGGEAQRLKLAGHLAQTTNKRTLFLFDEPTTGLHFDDIATLLTALRHLLELGHSVVVIEHNLDIIRAADWIVDLGPEGGDAGGEIVCVGTPEDVAKCERSYTGKALSSAGVSPVPFRAQKRHGRDGRATIRIHNAREHNLKNIDVRIPRDRFTVITGISGSGKSTLAFDILFAEGQRRYLESLNAYARQFVQPSSRADVDAVFGIPPTVAIEQRTSRGGRKSTVATVTEIYHFLRLLFVKLGTQYCPDCDVPIQPQSVEQIAAKLCRRGVSLGKGRSSRFGYRRVELFAPLVVARKGYYTDLAEWARRKGFSHLRVDGKLLPTASWPRLDRFKEHNIELPVGECKVAPKDEKKLRELLDAALQYGKGLVLVGAASPPRPGRANRGGDAAPTKSKKEALFSTRRACPKCERSFPELDPRLFSYNSKHGWCPGCYGTGLQLSGFDEEQTGEEIWWNEWFTGRERACPACAGNRLRPEALAVRFQDKSIADIAALPVEAAASLFGKMKLSGREGEIARDILAELRSRLEFLEEVGLAYLSLDRAAPTLSGGEAQRIRLAAQLGSNLRGVCYILDEPTIGLHPRDNRMLLDTLGKLEAKGNTVVVVEHDEDTIRHAEHIVDLGPGAGVDGGRLVAEGSIEDLIRNPESVTGKFLREPLQHPLVARPSRPFRSPKPNTTGGTPALLIEGAHLHNLKNLRVKIPLGRLVCVTGVSGSGKSTLVRDVLYQSLKNSAKPVGCERIAGAENVARVLEVDQTPIGKTPRSCPATYVGFWDDIRRLFASVPEARMRGYTASRFSFNVAEGRCPECAGQGVKKIEMSFLPDVTVHCEACAGKRFTPETLGVTWKGKNIGEVLAMNVEEAVEFFAAHRQIHRGLQLLQEVGLGYLTLGQQSPTLSGGEAQRIKLVTELAKANNTATLYALDEPTIGLHMADVEKLIRVLHRLVEAGNTVVIIEHNLDIIAEADWVIDLGPEGGDGGGRIVAQGSPDVVARNGGHSYTARILENFLRERRTRLTVDKRVRERSAVARTS